MDTRDRRALERIHQDLSGRMDRVEKKIDHQTEKCVGCAREFGEMSTEQQNLKDGLHEHKTAHWRGASLTVAICGVVAAVVAAVVNWIRGS